MKVWVKWLLIGGTIFYTLFGFFILPYIIGSKLPSIVQEATGAKAEVVGVSFNPFILQLDIYGFSLADSKGEALISLKHAIVDVELYSLVVGKFHLQRFVLDGLRLNIIQLEKGRFNFDDLLKQNSQSAEQSSESTDSELPAIMVDTFAIRNTYIEYKDFTREEPFDVGIGPLSFEVKNIDTTKSQNRDDGIRLHTAISDGGSLDIWSEIISLQPFAVKGKIKFESGKFYTQWRYLKEIFALEVANGKLYGGANFDIDTGNLEAMQIDQLHFALISLRIKPKSQHGDVLRVGLISLDGGTIEPLKQRIALEDFQIRDVAVFAKRESDGSVDWERFAQVAGKVGDEAESSTDQDSNVTESRPWHVILEHFSMDGIKTTFTDEAVTPHVITQLDNLKLDIHDITSQPATPIDYNLSLVLNSTMVCQGAGKAEHTPLNASSSLGCQAIDLTWFNPYIDQAAKGALQHYDIALEEAKVGFDLHLNAADHNGTFGINVHDTSLVLDGLKIRQPSTEAMLVTLKQMRIEGVSADTLSQKITMKNILLDRPSIYAERTKNGTINLSDVVVPKPEKKAGKSKKVKSGTSEKPWVVDLDKFVLDTGKVTFKDKAVDGGARFVIDKIGVKVSDIGTKPKSLLKYRTSMRINRSGTFKASGKLQHTPLKQSGSLVLKNFQFKELNPYLREQSHVNFKDGQLSYTTKESYAVSAKKADLSTEGEMVISKLALHDTRDDVRLLAFDTLKVNPILFEQSPDNLFIDEVLIDGFYANAVIDANGTMNLATLKKVSDQEGETGKTPDTNVTTEPFPVKIVKVKIENSSANFADYSLPFDFLTYIHDLEGVVYNVSSQSQETSYIDLNGVVDKYGSAKIKGSLNSADPKAFTDMGVSFRNLSLNNYSPYSGKFVGRKIDDGKLFIDLGYKINDSEMMGDNSVVIKKIKLGDDVESEDAVSLPLGLAIALLEDSDGVIDIDMPVEGNVDNPDFKYGTVVWNAVTNLITSVVTAPFRFLGSMLGIEGEALEYMEFEPGKSDLLPSEIEKLDALSKALKKRPLLQLGITGTYDAGLDKKALQTEKLIAAAIKGKEAGKDASELTREILEELYIASAGEKQLDSMQKVLKKANPQKKQFEAAYQVKLQEDLIGMQSVSAEELQALASKRSEMIASYLSIAQGVSPKRLNVKESGISDEESVEWVKIKLSIEVKEQ